VGLLVLLEGLEFSGVLVFSPSILNGLEVDFKVSREGSESLLDDLKDLSDNVDFFNSGFGGVDEFGGELSAHGFSGTLKSVVSGEFSLGGGDDLVLINTALGHSSDLLLGSNDVLLEGSNGLLESELEFLEGDDSLSLDLLVHLVVSLESDKEGVEGGLQFGAEGLVGVVGVVVLSSNFVVLLGGGDGNKDGDSLVEETQLGGVSEELLGFLNEREGLHISLEFLGNISDEVVDEGNSLFEIVLSDFVSFVFSGSLSGGLGKFGLVHFKSGDQFREVLLGGLEGDGADSSGGSGLGEGGVGGVNFLLSE
jgi:hypothetical protein